MDLEALTPENLWRVLRGHIEALCALFGLPQKLAARTWLARWEARRISNTLRPVEILLRRLVFFDALRLRQTPAPETKSRPQRTMTGARGASFDPDNPESWTVRFDLGDALAPKRAVRRARPTHEPSRQVSSAPLALRLEALIRGFNDPASLAQRLARRLSRHPTLAPRYSARVKRRGEGRAFWREVRQAGELVADELGAAVLALALVSDTS